MPVPITIAAASMDLSGRFKMTTTVAASPTDATETVIATLTLNTDETIEEGVHLEGWAAYTVGTNGTSGRLRIRRTNVNGTTVADTGACTRTAAQLVEQSIRGLDTGAAVTGQVYVLTLTVGAASAGSTVSAVALEGLVV